MADETTQMLGQTNWGDGMNCYQPGAAQYLFGQNIIIRTGKAETRPGVRRFWKSDAAGLIPAFWFNQDNAKYNDGTHTGFWFPWDWVKTVWGSIQGFGVIRFPEETAETILIVTQGQIYRVYSGFMEKIPCSVEIGEDETITVQQAFDKIILWRGDALIPLGWGGDEGGFVEVPDAEVGDNIPWTSSGVLSPGGRVWTFEGRDNVLASDILDFTEWDRVYQMFSVKAGDGDQIMALCMFHQDTLLVFKRRSISYLSGINSVVNLQATPAEHLSDFVATSVVDSETGLVAPLGFVTVGEDVWYMGAGGIYSLSRNQQNHIQRQAVALSAPVQTLMNRINPRAIDKVVAGIGGNYVLFAVPLDDSLVNNAILVYDLLAPTSDGTGAWVGVWTSKGTIFDVRRFFLFNSEFLYLDGQGVIRQLFCQCANDSDEPFSDVLAWDSETAYHAGDSVKANGVIYEASGYTLGEAPDSTPISWTVISDPEHYFDIRTILTSPLYTLGGGNPPMKLGRGEILLSHQWPMLTAEIFSDVNGDLETLFDGVEYDPTEFDVCDMAEWDPASDPTGLRHAYRKDYPALIGTDGVMLDEGGIMVGKWKMHNLRFLRRLLRDRGFGVKLTNSRGQIRVEAISMPVDVRRHAMKQTV